MTIKELLLLSRKNISSLDGEVLLAYSLGKKREYLFMYGEEEVSSDIEKKFFSFLERRKKCEPVAYITNSKEFYGRDFFVNSFVLIPRPETEELIDLVKEVENKELNIVELGVGSGCVSATLALEGFSNISASDISKDALDVAKKNFSKYGLDIHLKEASLLEACLGAKIDILIGNLPYIPLKIKDSLSRDVLYEPPKSLFGGDEGFSLYIDLIDQIKEHKEIKYFFFEIDDSYAVFLLEKYSKELGFWKWGLREDFSGKKRFLLGLK